MKREVAKPPTVPRRLLLFRQLAPGDVVLSSDDEKSSKTIRKAAGGQYSHVALILGAYMWLESTWDEAFSGVRLTSVQPTHMRTRGGPPDPTWTLSQLEERTEPVLMLQENSAFAVYRFAPTTDAMKIHLEEFKGLILEYARPYFAKTYSSSEMLVEAWLGSRVTSGVTRKALKLACRTTVTRCLVTWLLRRWLPRHSVGGYFCSQLVAQIFSDAGLWPCNITTLMPSDFMSVMQPVEAVVRVDDHTDHLRPLDESGSSLQPALLRGSAAGQSIEAFELRLHLLTAIALTQSLDVLDKFTKARAQHAGSEHVEAWKATKAYIELIDSMVSEGRSPYDSARLRAAQEAAITKMEAAQKNAMSS